MDLDDCSGGSFASAEPPSDVAVFPGIAHCVIFAFVTTAYMVSEPLPPTFFLQNVGSAVFADHHFRPRSRAALRLSVGASPAAGCAIRSFRVGRRAFYPQENDEPE